MMTAGVCFHGFPYSKACIGCGRSAVPEDRTGEPLHSGLTPELYAELAQKSWKANSANAESVAKAVFARNPIPPIVVALDGMPKFLAELQRDSFVLGFVACMEYWRLIAEAVDKEVAAEESLRGEVIQ